ncbi:MAG: GNAT family N-acetyltransferase [Bacteroidales bacterium]|nr:GNAT family N-acetyltransferase [Bacteroidales bacterium]
MKVETNGILIERLQEKDIEMVRQWRNSEFVRRHMNYREHITPEMQQQWFRSIDNFNNFYFILRFKGLKAGLGDIKNVDWEAGTGEAGVFIAEKQYTSSFLPVVGALTLSELVFKIFKLERIYSQIRSDNKRALRFNSLFGYKREEGQEGKESQLHYLTSESFFKATRKFFLLLKPLGFSTGNLVITIEPHDYKTDFGAKMEKLIRDSDMQFKVVKEGGSVIFKEAQG